MKENLTRRLFRILFRLMAYRSPMIDVPSQSVALIDVTVVNPGKERLKGQTLVVEGDRITQLSSDQQSSVENRNQRYAGCYVLPGLIDMHVHVPPQIRELVNLLFLAHGVTAIREVGDADGTTWRARERIQGGEAPGPRIFTCGPVLDGHPPFLPTSWAIRDATEARKAVAVLAARGADFIKVHHKLSAEALAAVRKSAVEAGLRVVGHIPTSVPFEKAGVWDVQHLDGLVPYPQPPETPLDYQRKWLDLDAAQIDGYVKVSVDQGLTHTPTLITNYALARMADPHQPDDPALLLLPRHYREGVWDRQNIPVFNAFSDEVLALIKQSADRALEIVHHLHRDGVRIHLGTDTAAVPFVVPGASLHRELGLMVKAGLTVGAAWEAGTRMAGESLGVPRLGTVRNGAPADLLIFDKDPSRDLDALSTLKGVVAQGRLYSKTFLNEALSWHRERFEQPLYDTFSTALVRLGAKLMSTN